MTDLPARTDEAAPFDLVYLSLGAGVQSSALLVCSALGLHGVPKAAVAIFADTQNEPRHVYEAVDRLRAWAAPHGIPVETVTEGNLLEDAKARIAGTRSRFASIPTWVRTYRKVMVHSENRVAVTDGLVPTEEHVCDAGCHQVGVKVEAAPGRRQFTREYKIEPIERRVREILGYRPRQRVKKRALGMVGISVDELYRVKPSLTKWVTRGHPLVDARLRRADCVRIVVEAGLPEPRKSACVFCPYTDDLRWQEMKRDDPESFELACLADEALRDQSSSGLREPAFVHRSLLPLRLIDFDQKVRDRFATPLFDDAFANECEGFCGV